MKAKLTLISVYLMVAVLLTTSIKSFADESTSKCDASNNKICVIPNVGEATGKLTNAIELE